MRFCISSLICIAFVATALTPTEAPKDHPGRPISTADTVLAIYVRHDGRRAPKSPGLVMAVWPDGTAIWSDDRTVGGPPYRSGHVDPKRVAAALKRIGADGYFDDESLGQLYVGPDAGSTILLAKAGKKKVDMQSWHELYEGNGAVAREGGLGTAEGSRLAALKAESAKYLYYRMAWSELRGQMTALIPNESRPVEGRLVFSAGEAYWQPGRDERPK
jgi:hypothetical protein